METSIAGVVGFLEDNDSLIKQLMETAESAKQEISDLSIQVDHAREEATELIDHLGTVEFAVGKQDETKVRQKALLEAVAALRKKFETYKNDPLRRGVFTQRRYPICTCSWPTPSTMRPSPGSFHLARTKSRPIKSS